MNSMELISKLAELEIEAKKNRERPHDKNLIVKIRIRCGGQIQVIDLEPGMVSMTGLGSDEGPEVALIDLS